MAVVVLDASVVIGFLDSADAHHARAVEALRALGESELVLPATAYAEVLVGPWRSGPEAVDAVEQFVADLALRVEPVTADIARQAARLRAARRPLTLPDALVLATADVLSASALLTADRAWARLSRRVRVI